jgi:hypothetical protein
MSENTTLTGPNVIRVMLGDKCLLAKKFDKEGKASSTGKSVTHLTTGRGIPTALFVDDKNVKINLSLYHFAQDIEESDERIDM